MTLAITAAPLNSERRDMSVSGTRAVVSSQQLMRASECHRKVRCRRQEPLGVMLQTYRCSLQRSSSSERSRSDRVLAGIIERCCPDDMPASKLMSNA
jgi:hypothetical protein